jgi:predicted  nucleic acid-binding Zn-ribbon protein
MDLDVDPDASEAVALTAEIEVAADRRDALEAALRPLRAACHQPATCVAGRASRVRRTNATTVASSSSL